MIDKTEYSLEKWGVHKKRMQYLKHEMLKNVSINSFDLIRPKPTSLTWSAFSQARASTTR